MPVGDATASALLSELATAFDVEETDRTLIKYTLLLLHVEELENAKGGLVSQSQAGVSYTAYEIDELLANARDELARLESRLDSTEALVAVIPSTSKIAQIRYGGVR